LTKSLHYEIIINCDALILTVIGSGIRGLTMNRKGKEEKT